MQRPAGSIELMLPWLHVARLLAWPRSLCFLYDRQEERRYSGVFAREERK